MNYPSLKTWASCFITHSGPKRWHKHKAWHRDTSITFSILPIHHFSKGDDYYVVKVTGNTDPSQQYAHIS
ncbi:MAG: hypothetical protein IJR27_07850, partial [Synergistaceae bacterium]|nr:hypothetical protein [Synergistaceae bacterium]